jgi:hypothetical protein
MEQHGPYVPTEQQGPYVPTEQQGPYVPTEQQGPYVPTEQQQGGGLQALYDEGDADMVEGVPSSSGSEPDAIQGSPVAQQPGK